MSRIFLLFLILSQLACTRQENVEVNFHYDYFPLEVGKFIEYQVDSTIYYYDAQSIGIKTRTSSTFLREEIVKSIIGGDGQTDYVLERYERKNTTDSWQITNVWAVERTEKQAHRTEENNRFIKLIFPVSEEVTPWDGNAFIDENTTISVGQQSLQPFKFWNYEYVDVHNFYEAGELEFDSTVTVIQANISDFIEHRYSKEVYAKGIGLIAREMQILDSQCEFSECTEDTPWLEKAEKGFLLDMFVTGYN